MSATVLAPGADGRTRIHGRSGDGRRRTGSLVRVAALDDHWAVRAGLEAVINSQADMVLVGSAADEHALASLLERTDPSILMLDVDHPGLDGFAIGLRLRRRAGPPRVVLHSGRRETALLTAAAAVAGIDPIVTKSATRRELLEAIRDVAHHRARIDVPLVARSRAAARLDPADHAILAMRIDGSSWARVASTLGIDDPLLARRASAIVAALTTVRGGPARRPAGGVVA